MSLSEQWLSFGAASSGFDMNAMRAGLASLDGTMIDALTKGFPPNAPAMTLGDIGAQAWNVLGDNLPFPVAVLKRDALENNARSMQTYQRNQHVGLAPHAKTTMSPHLWALQAAAGCWGLTVATVQQAGVAAKFGCRNIILANQVMGHANLMGLMNLHRNLARTRIMVFVESPQGIQSLLEVLRGCGCERPLDVLIELGMKGGRTGCRDMASVDKLLDILSGERERLRLVGVAAFEGIVKSSEDSRLADLVAFLAEAAALVDRRNLFADGEAIISAGGSAYFDVIAHGLQSLRLSRPHRVILRSGCYLTHDSHEYETHQQEMRARHPQQFQGMPPLAPALFVWAAVQARPEQDLAIVSMGKRDVGFDVDMPMPLLRFRRHKMAKPIPVPDCEIFALNDQHAYLRVPKEDDLAIGDFVCFGVSHPCTTFDRWRLIHVVDDDWTSMGAILTYF